MDVAEQLAVGPDEASWRTAVGRAYYAAIGVAHEALPGPIRSTINPGNFHERTWALYAASSYVACRQVGNAGLRLRRRRRIADYRADIEVTGPLVRVAIEDARRIIALIDRHGYHP
jgi:hypothetical protein